MLDLPLLFAAKLCVTMTAMAAVELTQCEQMKNVNDGDCVSSETRSQLGPRCYGPNRGFENFFSEESGI